MVWILAVSPALNPHAYQLSRIYCETAERRVQMTISSSLNAGVAGLAANATRLGTISDNIANSATNGYKRVETDFTAMVISGNGSSYTAGGVRTTTQRLVDERGALVATTNATDLAVRGNGFLPVAQASEVLTGNVNQPPFHRTPKRFLFWL